MSVKFGLFSINFPTINFIRLAPYAAILSILLTLIALGATITRGLNLGIDFAGGVILEVEITPAPEISELRKLISSITEDSTIQGYSNSNQFVVKFGTAGLDEAETNQILSEAKNLLSRTYGEKLSILRSDLVGPQVGSELIQNGVLALVLGLGGIMIYLWQRFEWQFGLGAVLALLHDAAMVMGFYAISGIEFNLTSIAALLTVLGYSVNDSVIIYDRIRENIPKLRNKYNIPEILNISINSTMSRTTLTVATTALADLSLVIFGGEVIQGFGIAVLVGIVVGTYSSIFISAPILTHFLKDRHLKTASHA